MANMVAVPTALLKKLSKAAQVLQKVEEEFEDFLSASDPASLAKMRKARAEHIAGKTKPLPHSTKS